jgi:hypothetical protein
MSRSAEPRSTRIARVVLAACALACFLVGFLQFRTELIDDAYISLRYARNLESGLGLVWNPGEPIEGYTDFFWVVLLSICGATPGAALALGALAGALLVGALAAAPRSARVPGVAGALLPLTVAANLSVPFWAAKGLETPLFALLVTSGLLLYAGSLDEPARAARRGLLGIHLLALSALTRPEGLIFLALSIADVVRRRRSSTAPIALALPVVVLLPHFAFRLAYYGYPLPNTFYAKVGFGLDQFLRGADYLGEFFLNPGGILLAFALLGAASRSPAHRFLAVALAAGLAGVVYVGGDAFGAYRFVVPLVPVLHLLAIAGACRLAARLPGAATRAAPAVFAAALAASAFSATRAPVLAEEREVRRFTSLMVEVGKLLKEVTPPRITIALNPSGAVPYYSERRAIDMLGLNDLHIAHLDEASMGHQKAGHEKGDGAYILSRRPELILIGNVWVDEKTEITKLHPSRKSEVQLVQRPETYEHYEMVLFPLPDGTRSLKALARRDATRLPKSGWGPTKFTPIEKPKWE